MNKFLDDSLMQAMAHNIASNKTRISNIDAEINGGALVEVCNVLGNPLYMRVDHHDPDKAKHELEKMRSLLRDVVLPNEGFEYKPANIEWLTLKQAAEKSGLSIITLRRYIKADRLPKKKRGKEYIVSQAALEAL